MEKITETNVFLIWEKEARVVSVKFRISDEMTMTIVWKKKHEWLVGLGWAGLGWVVVWSDELDEVGWVVE